MSLINKWLYPGIRIKRWLFLFILSIVVLTVGFAGIFGGIFRDVKIKTTINVDNFFYRLQKLKAMDYLFIILGTGGVILAIRRTYYSMLTVYAPDNGKDFLNLAYRRAKLKRGPKIAAIGGGTGMPNVLRGMKRYTANLSAVVTVADDGGSSGRLRKDYSILPPGDIRNCIVALADEETLLGKLFQYRFGKKGELAGHSFGNLFITAMSHVVGDMPSAINESSKVLAIHGQVHPVTLANITLKAKLKDGRRISGESNIPKAKGRIERVYISPANCSPYPAAIESIKNADVVVIGPGSLYTSIIPNLIVDGVSKAMRNRKSLKIYICNVMTQPGETDGYKVSDHIRAIFDHAGTEIIDYVIANNKIPAREVAKRYAREQAYPVEIDRHEIQRLGVKLIEGALFDDGKFIRHSPEILASMIMKRIIV
jgi:uncharacterized cofD-like protein